MENIFISKITVKQVGHLQNISLPLSREERKHLILTGFNGSGKSRVLKALACCLREGNETDGISVELNKQPETEDFIKAYYPPDRAPGEDFIEYLQLKAGSESWFLRFEEILRDIFDDASLQLLFDPHSSRFLIQTQNRDPVGLNFLSAGYSGILAIVCDLIRRMDTISPDLPGDPVCSLHPLPLCP